MKTDIIFSEGIKQIIFTPENDGEKHALQLITPEDNISLAVHHGSFGEPYLKPFAANIQKCRGEYLRVFNSENSIMLVLEPKKADVNDDKTFSIEEMRNCFEESRLTHPMIGFKHDTFDNYMVQFNSPKTI